MPIAATVTGVTGPAQAMTAQAYTGIGSMLLETVGKEVLTLYPLDSRPPITVSIAAATTVTVVISAGDTYTVTVS